MFSSFFASSRKLRSAPSKRRQGGFSLVEVTLAVGITGTALLVIFSLMPLGLSSLQEAQRQIVETEIYNKIGSELRSTALYKDPTKAENLLTEYCDSTRFPAYFDIEGNELAAPINSTSASPALTAPAGAMFIVRCVQSPPSAESWTPSPTGELLYGTVRIGYHKDPGTGSTAAYTARQRTFLLSNHGS